MTNKITCPHCGAVGNDSNHFRCWHFSRCKRCPPEQRAAPRVLSLVLDAETEKSKPGGEPKRQDFDHPDVPYISPVEGFLKEVQDLIDEGHTHWEALVEWISKKGLEPEYVAFLFKNNKKVTAAFKTAIEDEVRSLNCLKRPTAKREETETWYEPIRTTADRIFIEPPVMPWKRVKVES
jgi:hypothetical protein